MSCHISQLSRKRPAFGKVAKIIAVGREARCLEKAIEGALDVISNFESMISMEGHKSDLMRLLSRNPGEFVKVPSALRQILLLANDIAYRTDGLFDVVSAGSGGNAQWTDIDLSQPGYVRLIKPLSISLGGMAKGYAVDMAIRALQESGVGAGLVDIGGCIRAFGAREWRVEFVACSGEGSCQHVGGPEGEERVIPVILYNNAIAGFGPYFGAS